MIKSDISSKISKFFGVNSAGRESKAQSVPKSSPSGRKTGTPIKLSIL
ncbi:MAG: hypothetical protein ABIP06_11770 [Pyrinomonadaceae bacterium]